MEKEKERIYRTPDMMRTMRGYVVNKWCGSCQYKEIGSASSGSADSQRHCTRLGIDVEIDNICREFELHEKLAAL